MTIVADVKRARTSPEVGWLEARHAAHFGPVAKLDLTPLALNQSLALEVGEHAVDVDRCLTGDVGDLLLGERDGHPAVFALDAGPRCRLAQQVRDARGGVAPAAIDE